MEDYVWEVLERNDKLIQDLVEAANVSRATALVLAQRGVLPDDVEEFLRPTLQGLSDPFKLPGALDAAARLWKAIHSGEQILIHGDYDTDGITATALLAWVLRKNGATVKSYLPHRIDDGYGLTPDSIRKAVAEEFKLLVTVDCGITSYDAINTASELGMEVIVTDHHVPGTQEVKAVAVVA